MYNEKSDTGDMSAAKEHMLLCLEQMRQNGVSLFMDGRPVLPKEVVAKAVRENSPYMADYVLDNTGMVRQVHFDKVTRC